MFFVSINTHRKNHRGITTRLVHNCALDGCCKDTKDFVLFFDLAEFFETGCLCGYFIVPLQKMALMKTLCIFNPEHDLCLANGDKNYVPPRSAMKFADAAHHVMGVMYDACTASMNSIPQEVIGSFADYEIVPWGWNAMLKQSLVRIGYPENMLPDDAFVAFVRKMQNRASFLPLMADSSFVDRVSDIELLHLKYGNLVLKAPWSGSGRGIHLVRRSLKPNDYAWTEKIIEAQGGVLVEPFRDIVMEFALEYSNGEFVGYSLFSSQSCVYKFNILLNDNEIEDLISAKTSLLVQKRTELEKWLRLNVFPRYNGPLGVDMYVDYSGNLYVSEMNLRHTIGHLAHAFLLHNPQMHNEKFSIGT